MNPWLFLVRALLVVLFSAATFPTVADHSMDHNASSLDGSGSLNTLDSLGLSRGGGSSEPEFLDPEIAYVMSAELRENQTVVVRWDVRDGYYLYRERFSFTSQDTTVARLGAPRLPKGKFKEDPYFGRQEVYYHQVEVEIPLLRSRPEAAELTLEIGYQGCADAGLCYPPIKKNVSLEMPAAAASGTSGG